MSNLETRISRIFIFLIILIFANACINVVKIRDGETAFERKLYAEAIPMFKEDYDRTEYEDVKAYKAFYIAESHRRIGEYKQAETWYEKAIEHDYGYEAYFQYGIILKQTGEFAKAKNIFQYLNREYSGDRRLQKELTTLNIIQAWEKTKENRGVKLSNVPVNSTASDYYPRRLNSGELLFISDRNSERNGEDYMWTGREFSTLYSYDINQERVSPYQGKLSGSKLNEGIIAQDSSGKVIVYTICGSGNDASYEDEYCLLYIQEEPGSSYSEPELLPFIEEGYNYLHPCLNAAGDLLIFSAILPDGVGNYDLWYSRKVSGEWQYPKLLSNRINTEGDEMFPNLDGDTLYFSSNYLTGYGGFDIFKSYIDSDGRWTSPENLKSPINSGYDDIGFVPDQAYANAHNLDFAGYFSSNRPGGKGSDDIYFFTQKEVPILDTIPDEEESPVVKLQLKLEIKKKQFKIKDEPNSGLDKLLDLPFALVEIRENGKKTEELRTNEAGTTTIPIDTAQQYSFRITSDNYLSKSMEFNPRGRILPDRELTTVIRTVVLDSIFRNVEIVLDDIYYDFDKWDIREDAMPTLDSLASILKDNPLVNIELSSHTDCRGGEDYNKALSQRRAESAVEYLIGRGINQERLTATGYGDSRPAVDCACGDCTEEEHQANRRTSFTILE